ncbi:MAG TPA: carboxymuconolactone decarboxylase family protein, partial [Acidimicrobiia bacterium]|nr:carboxymuconolactone decarboxylase family protein [Acidimicrobiia bacterium]
RAPGETALDEVFGLIPDAYARFREFYGSLWTDGDLDPALLELARLRIAQVVGATGEARVRFGAGEAGPTAAQIAALSRWPSAPEFSPVERAAIGFAEQYALDPHELRDREFDALREHLTAPQISAFVLCVAMFDALARFRTALGADPDDEIIDAPIPSPTAGSLP